MDRVIVTKTDLLMCFAEGHEGKKRTKSNSAVVTRESEEFGKVIDKMIRAESICQHHNVLGMHDRAEVQVTVIDPPTGIPVKRRVTTISMNLLLSLDQQGSDLESLIGLTILL